MVISLRTQTFMKQRLNNARIHIFLQLICGYQFDPETNMKVFNDLLDLSQCFVWDLQMTFE